MDKKTLGIVLGVLVVAVAGIVYFGYQRGFVGGGIDKDSIMGAMKESGQVVMSKSEFISKCKESDKDSQDMCYGMGALYYRDASFCKLITDSEAKGNCTKENIEKYYSEMGKGGTMLPGFPGGTIPTGGDIPEGGVVPDNGGGTGSGATNLPPVSGGGKMTDDVYVEILAQTSVYSSSAAADPRAWASRMKALYEKYGVTEESMEAYASELEKDPQRAAELGQRYLQRAMELRGMGQ